MAIAKIIIKDVDNDSFAVELVCDTPMELTENKSWTAAQKLAADFYTFLTQDHNHEE